MLTALLPSRRTAVTTPAVATLALALLALVAACSPAPSAAPTLADPAAEGSARVNAYFTALQSGEAAQVDGVLAPNAQIARANGTVVGHDEYLKTLPTIKSFTIADVNATQSGDVLVVTYSVTTDQVVDGKAQPTTAAPRMSVFQWQNGAWRLLAHANFNAVNK